MSTFKRQGAQVYSYDFWIAGRRFSGSTEATSKREADAVEKRLKAKARDDIETEKRNGQGPMTLRHACGKYWEEEGKYFRTADKIYAYLKRIVEYVGPDKRIDEIDDATVTDLIAWRREQTTCWGAKLAAGRPDPRVANRTVNHSTLQPLCNVLTRARAFWKLSLPREPNWTMHRLPEPEARVRELSADEELRLFEALRGEYAPWVEFALLTGLRLEETIIRWNDVNWSAGKITTVGKGGRLVTTPITPAVAAILDDCRGHNDEFVFTYRATATRDCVVRGRHYKHVRGARYPLTLKGAARFWAKAVEAAGIRDFRFHDLRHTTASRLLRETGNLRIVQQALNHKDIASTARYAHVLDREVADGLQRIATSRTGSHGRPREKAQT